MRWFKWFCNSGTSVSVPDSEGLPLPPFEMLDGHYCFDDGTVLKVIGFQYGGKHLRVPFVLRCRVIETQEIVLVDPDYIRQFAKDITPYPLVCEAFRKPYVPRNEEVVRVVGWVSKNDSRDQHQFKSCLKRITEEIRTEGQRK